MKHPRRIRRSGWVITVLPALPSFLAVSRLASAGDFDELNDARLTYGVDDPSAANDDTLKNRTCNASAAFPPLTFTGENHFTSAGVINPSGAALKYVVHKISPRLDVV